MTSFQINTAEMRISQLTTLLHESEAENAKFTQLTDALKEEIRRSTRNEDREKHMENMEYMKNVILKVTKFTNDFLSIMKPGAVESPGDYDPLLSCKIFFTF